MLRTRAIFRVQSLTRPDNVDLTSPPTWWKTHDSFSLTSQFRMELDYRGRPPLENDRDSFVPYQGMAQMVINLLPFSRHLVIKYRERGIIVTMRVSRQTRWVSERSNIHGRYIVSSGGGNVASSCWSISPRVTFLQNESPVLRRPETRSRYWFRTREDLEAQNG